MAPRQSRQERSGTFDRARKIGSGPTSGLWALAFIAGVATAALSWDRGRIAWTGVILTVALVAVIWVWAKARGWPFLPW